MTKHRRDVVVFADSPDARGAFGPFSMHWATHRSYRNDGRKDIDGRPWYMGVAVPGRARQ